MEIKLKKTWKLGKRIGNGGFGSVFRATTEGDEKEYAVKLVPKTEGASREQLFVTIEGAKNVLRVVENGETDDSWVLVMPLAEKSLRSDLAGSGLGVEATLAVLKDVAEALCSIEGKVVHRDLKPDNILFYEGKWCLADFGISRYAEASTAPDTQKYAWSWGYAGPERWKGEHADIKTDIYSLGIVGYEMLSGSKPFDGPSREDFRQQHLHETPRRIMGADGQLVDLILECLYKPVGARPQLANISARLARIGNKPGKISLPGLQKVNSDEVARIGEEKAVQSKAQTEMERREDLFQHANEQLIRYSNSLADAIIENASTATITNRVGPSWLLRLGKASVQFSPITRQMFLDWDYGHKPALDVIATAEIILKSAPDRIGHEGRSHSLWFCDAETKGEYAWYETAFMISPLIPKEMKVEPFALDPGKDAAQALSNVMGGVDVALPFRRVDNESLADFIERWANYLAANSERFLRPSTMPPEGQPQGSWRRS